MPFNEILTDRIREILAEEKGVIEKKMFGGVAFMKRDKMFVGVTNDDLMVRCMPERHEELLDKPGARPMDFTGKPMRGFLFVGLEDLKTNKQLKYWVDVGIEYVLKSPPKKKKK